MTATALVRLSTPLDANWRLRGHCVTRPSDNRDLMHPDNDAEAKAQAKRKCSGCPVARECFIDSINQLDFEGVRAGMTGGERKAWFDAHHPAGKERAGRGKTPPMGCTVCRVPRLQHATKGHSYRPPAMPTVLARAAALKTRKDEQRADYLHQISRCEHRPEWRQAGGLCGGCGKDGFAEITEEAA